MNAAACRPDDFGLGFKLTRHESSPNKGVTVPAAAYLLHQNPAQSPAPTQPAGTDPERLPPKERKRWEPRSLRTRIYPTCWLVAPANASAALQNRALECSDVLELVSTSTRPQARPATARKPINAM